LGYIFQRGLLLPELTALENVVLGLSLAGLPARRAERRARQLLARLGLGDRLGARPAELSGGEQQRVAIARAVGAGPDLLLADEPTASLDWTAGRAALEAMIELAREGGSAVLLATHDERVMSVGTRLLRLADGALLEDRAVRPEDCPR
jgi:ABC-type lipoprotein export system ATPase subunit